MLVYLRDNYWQVQSRAVVSRELAVREAIRSGRADVDLSTELARAVAAEAVADGALGGEALQRALGAGGMEAMLRGVGREASTAADPVRAARVRAAQRMLKSTAPEGGVGGATPAARQWEDAGVWDGAIGALQRHDPLTVADVGVVSAALSLQEMARALAVEREEVRLQSPVAKRRRKVTIFSYYVLMQRTIRLFNLASERERERER